MPPPLESAQKPQLGPEAAHWAQVVPEQDDSLVEMHAPAEQIRPAGHWVEVVQ